MNTINLFKKKMERFPLIAIEGLDGAGKSTLIKKINNAIGIQSFDSVPAELNALRIKTGHTGSPLATFKFFTLSNILRSFQFKQLVKKNTVVVDRYIFSTLTYHQIMLKHELNETISLLKSDNFFWPDYVIFIIANATIRKERIAQRDNDKLQWYGDQISFSPDIVEQYKMNFQNIGVSYGIVDTSKFNEKQSFKQLIKLIQTNI